MAERLQSMLPGLDLVRMVNSGTEATMSAIRLARGFTGRDYIIKFEGCYHGHADSLLVKAGSGALTLGEPSSAGVPAATAATTITLSYNDIGAVHRAFNKWGPRIAAVIVEPVAGNMNLVLPQPGFLETLRECCTQAGAVLIFDEVMTGFRVGAGCAQGRYQIRPDLTTLGKVIGGGLPVGAFGGRGDIMECIAPLGPVYQAGTLSGNSLAMAAGLATLEAISAAGFYERICELTAKLLAGIQLAADGHGVALSTNQAGSMFGLFFTDAGPATNLTETTACNIEEFNQFYHAMLDGGVYLAPSGLRSRIRLCRPWQRRDCEDSGGRRSSLWSVGPIQGLDQPLMYAFEATITHDQDPVTGTDHGKQLGDQGIYVGNNMRRRSTQCRDAFDTPVGT